MTLTPAGRALRARARDVPGPGCSASAWGVAELGQVNTWLHDLIDRAVVGSF